MGTRADFYVGRGKNARWLGSIAWDGYSVPDDVRFAANETDFAQQVACFLASRKDATLPDQGWPWPWEDSRTTDYAWSFDPETGNVWWSHYGRPWQDAREPDPEELPDEPRVEFPDMTDRKNVTLGPRSGVFLIPGLRPRHQPRPARPGPRRADAGVGGGKTGPVNRKVYDGGPEDHRWINPWRCDCGARGEQHEARIARTARGGVVILCPECGRRVRRTNRRAVPYNDPSPRSDPTTHDP